MAFEKRVELAAWLQNPELKWDAEDAVACGAWGCFSEKDSVDIHTDELAKTQEKQEENKEKIFRETSGRGHGAVLDHSQFLFSIDNLTRASTLMLCAPQYASHLQQSLRRATAERGYHVPETLKDTCAKELMEKQFALYSKMQGAGVPSEDARYILPLATKTTIQTSIDPRELMHLHHMADRTGVPEEVRDTISQMVALAAEKAPRLMVNRKENYNILAWMPASQLFAVTNRTIEDLISSSNPGVSLVNHAGIKMRPEDVERAVKYGHETELANLKHYHFTFLAPMSLASFHQATRQRTWDQSVQTVRDAVINGSYVTPPSVARSELAGEYKALNEESLIFALDRLSGREYPEVLMTVPHSLQVYDLIHVNGWNAIHSIGKRTCTEAQWEIRGVAREMAEYINSVAPEVGAYSKPQGIIYGKCPERKSCGLCDKKQ